MSNWSALALLSLAAMAVSGVALSSDQVELPREIRIVEGVSSILAFDGATGERLPWLEAPGMVELCGVYVKAHRYGPTVRRVLRSRTVLQPVLYVRSPRTTVDDEGGGSRFLRLDCFTDLVSQGR